MFNEITPEEAERRTLKAKLQRKEKASVRWSRIEELENKLKVAERELTNLRWERAHPIKALLLKLCNPPSTHHDHA